MTRDIYFLDTTKTALSLPIYCDKDYPEVRERLGITLPNIKVNGRISSKAKELIHERFGEPYLITADYKSRALNLIIKIMIPVREPNKDNWVDLFPIVYTEEKEAYNTWTEQGFEVATSIKELIHWY